MIEIIDRIIYLNRYLNYRYLEKKNILFVKKNYFYIYIYIITKIFISNRKKLIKYYYHIYI